MIPRGWKITVCPRCRFVITTMPGGTHYCPRCKNAGKLA